MLQLPGHGRTVSCMLPCPASASAAGHRLAPCMLSCSSLWSRAPLLLQAIQYRGKRVQLWHHSTNARQQSRVLMLAAQRCAWAPVLPTPIASQLSPAPAPYASAPLPPGLGTKINIPADQATQQGWLKERPVG